MVERPELFAKLGAAARVMHVSAPAGTGKTSLVRSWTATTGLAPRTAWVTVSRGERDPQQFWFSVLDALRGLPVGASEIQTITPTPDVDADGLVSRLLADLDGLTEPIWLVLDDLHELASREARGRLEQFIAAAPATVRFILITRRDLRLGLHRLRLEGELTEIRAADLRFTRDEARELFESAQIELSAEALERLVDRTEGWVAGLRLAALSLAGNDDPDGFAASFSGSDRTVSEYLIEEVLDRHPPEVTRLLLRTSLLERVTGPLADRLTGGTDGQRILIELEESGAFVTAIDPQRTWFRYHHLFADLLSLELRRSGAAEEAELHRLAATWLAEHGEAVDAVRHAQAAQDWTLATQIIADEWFGLYLDGRRETGRDLISRFPPSMLTADPQLATYAAGDALAHDSPAMAERHLSAAIGNLAAVAPDRRARLDLWLTMLQVALARSRNDFEALLAAARRLPALLADPQVGHAGFVDDARALALQELAAAEIWAGRFDDAEAHIEQALALARRADRPLIELAALSRAALLAGFRDETSVERLSRQALELAAVNGWESEPPAGTAHTLLGLTYLRSGRLVDAEESLGRGALLLRQESDPMIGAMLQVGLGLLAFSQGRHDAALRALRTGERLAGELAVPHEVGTRARAHKLLTLISLGQTDRVGQELAALEGEDRDRPEMALVLAALRLAEGRSEAAADVLAPLCGDLEQFAAHPTLAIQALLLEAGAADRMRDAGATSRALERALDIAERVGLLLPFLLHPEPELIERHGRLGTAHASLVADILTLLAGRALPAAAATEPLPEPLSQSELRVLRYLPTNLRAPEIAAEMFLSVNTIRTHMRHLYAKLGVHRRADAVERARALGLLARSTHVH